MRDLLTGLSPETLDLGGGAALTIAMGLYLWLMPAAYEAEIQFLVKSANRAGAVVALRVQQWPGGARLR